MGIELNPFDEDFGKETSNGPSFDDVANVVINVMTGGLAGYQNGQVDPRAGYTTRGADEALGEITGRNLAREQLNQARAAAVEEAARRKQQEKDELERKRVQDVQASTAAGLLRASEQAKMRGVLGTDGDPTRDFLGI